MSALKRTPFYREETYRIIERYHLKARLGHIFRYSQKIFLGLPLTIRECLAEIELNITGP